MVPALEAPMSAAREWVLAPTGGRGPHVEAGQLVTVAYPGVVVPWRIKVRVLEARAAGRLHGRIESVPFGMIGIVRGDGLEFGPEHVI